MMSSRLMTVKNMTKLRCIVQVPFDYMYSYYWQYLLPCRVQLVAVKVMGSSSD